MNFLIIIITTAVLQIFAPWWVIGLIPFLVHFWRPTSYSNTFLSSFGAIAMVWLAYGLYLHINSGGAMSDRIAQIFSLPNGLLMLAVSTLVGGLAGGFAGMAGFSVRSLFLKN
ncbi:hypothetical protein DYBT9275_04486 [Dyadobacter sp. CECT 9275]|uniref:Uncharacterized protein n=1 Tax=Dyadobacter helix TaxID=2822344 RepID=A0A916JGM0_9BACT|nr:hypothetical protein [Dyadobacter sp. CECT 9275]CAG5009392.1 hypothetical protein DYBT9275_04486 [Dyadobacter sp. CECT 9275]